MIGSGELDFLYLLDIGGEVNPKGLHEKLSKYGQVSIDKISGGSWIEDGVRVSFKNHVRILGLEPIVEAKVFLIGALLVRVVLPIKNMSFQQLLDFISNAEQEVLVDGSTSNMNDFCLKMSTEIKKTLEPLIINPYSAETHSQSYRLVIANEMDGSLVEKSEREITGILRKEKFDRLSRSEIEDAVGTRYSYRDDLMIADLRGAFAVVKNLENFPVLRALELYLLQKLELRVYDLLLDEMLEKSYSILEKAESRASRELNEHIKDIHLMRLELLGIVSGMRYIKESIRARVFSDICATIATKFELDDYMHSVSRKLDKLGDI
jgi:hypothetical protein